MLQLIPSKAQWRKWSIPSRISYVGTCLGVLSIVLSIIFYLWPLTEPYKKHSVSDFPFAPAQSPIPPVTDKPLRTNGSPAALLKTSSKDTGPSLPPCSLRVMPNVTMTNVEATVQSVQNDLKLRALAPIETGKLITQTPVGTYSFVYARYLERDEGQSWRYENKFSVGRFGDRNSYFELLKTASESIFVIAFAGSAEAADAAILDGNTPKRITLFPLPSLEASSLLVIPLDRLVTASFRFIDADITRVLIVLDVVLR